VRHAPRARLNPDVPADVPRFDFDCAACGERFEILIGVHAERPTICPLCGGGPLKKAISAPAVHFKGSGWAKKERRAAVKSATPSSSRDEGSSDSAATGSEPAAATAKAVTDDGGTKASKSTDTSTASAAD
jgi:putative FmdB family regulatory protein